jgi:hypothetical protein
MEAVRSSRGSRLAARGSRPCRRRMRILIVADGTPEVVADAVADVRRSGLRARESWSDSGELQSWMPEYISRIVPVGILTMLRRGEILGPRDRDIDSATGSIAVFSQRQDGHEVRAKTRAGRRTIDVGPAGPAGHPQDPRPPRLPSAVHDRDRLCHHQPRLRPGQPRQARRPAARTLGDRGPAPRPRHHLLRGQLPDPHRRRSQRHGDLAQTWSSGCSVGRGRSTSPPRCAATPATHADPSPPSGSASDEPDITTERRSPAGGGAAARSSRRRLVRLIPSNMCSSMPQ